MNALHLDFETRSTVDLRKSGVYPYAEHPDTDVWCAAYAFGDDEPSVWVPGDPVPPILEEVVAEGLPIWAHNAQFERIIWWLLMTPRYGWPRPDREQFHDTAALAAAMALPRALDHAARVLGLDVAKDLEGHRLMMQMAKPRRPRKGEPKDKLLWWDDEERVKRLIEYCRQDVVVEKALAERLRGLSDFERQVYIADQVMNDRGVLIDLPLVHAAERIVAEGMARADAEIAELTNGEVAGVTKRGQLLRWLQTSGAEVEDVRKHTLRDLMGANDDLPDDVRRVVELRSSSAKTSTAKLASMKAAACSDGRVRGLLLYHGASTGRWAGRLVQPQNFPRPEMKDPEQYIPAVLAGDYDALEEDHPALVIISSLLRSMLRAAPGHRFVAGDYAQIEARVVAWIAEQDDLVALFAEGGKIYEEMAAVIYGKPVSAIEKDSVERQVGKNTVLGCGFGMGVDTYQAQAKRQTGLDLPTELCKRSVDAYRQRFPMIPRFWNEIDRAAIRAVEEPGEVTTCGRNHSIRFTVRGQFLWCVLPSGRPLAYAKPVVVERETPWGAVKPAVSFMGVNSYTKKWQRHYAYGGLFTENVVQAMARDLIAAAILRLEKAGYRPLLSVHDEVIAEPPIGHGTVEEFVHLMSIRPRWAAGLPVAVEGWDGLRYRK